MNDEVRVWLDSSERLLNWTDRKEFGQKPGHFFEISQGSVLLQTELLHYSKSYSTGSAEPARLLSCTVRIQVLW